MTSDADDDFALERDGGLLRWTALFDLLREPWMEDLLPLAGIQADNNAALRELADQFVRSSEPLVAAEPSDYAAERTLLRRTLVDARASLGERVSDGLLRLGLDLYTEPDFQWHGIFWELIWKVRHGESISHALGFEAEPALRLVRIAEHQLGGIGDTHALLEKALAAGAGESDGATSLDDRVMLAASLLRRHALARLWSALAAEFGSREIGGLVAFAHRWALEHGVASSDLPTPPL